ncbi:putative nucleoside diphosphate kinase [Trypanosoma vivax]|uniref:Putative nucleoside diphosphate kinase n=1 Tax=Trypanosoma vivax (strain Y486) TaxID=1055687 RepID=G0U343_TRYVY|nr:putative nucleoside diphosphate kinase [Trypanosoma vivax]CCC50698.1 putative nucleoside diphosphate kinase [Trypanosoma vivax Y486]
MSRLDRYAFKVDYFDAQASLTRQYLLLYYTEDSTVEMHDLKTKRVFLKRCTYPSLNPKELFIGATVGIFSRSLKLVDYGDEVTRRHFSGGVGEFIIVINNECLNEMGNIIDKMTFLELRITNARMTNCPENVCSEFNITKRSVVILCNGSDASVKVATLKEEYPKITIISNPQGIALIRDVAFGPGSTTAVTRDCSVCVIKPHAVMSGYHGAILQRLIDEGFHITALGMYTLSMADAEDFLEVYNGVVPEYKRLVEQMSSGPCWAVQVCSENPVHALRTVCGPHDPEVCHVLFPHSIRSKFGIDRTRNGVHCTDLEEDAPLESEFFFSLMQNM